MRFGINWREFASFDCMSNKTAGPTVPNFQVDDHSWILSCVTDPDGYGWIDESSEACGARAMWAINKYIVTSYVNFVGRLSRTLVASGRLCPCKIPSYRTIFRWRPVSVWRAWVTRRGRGFCYGSLTQRRHRTCKFSEYSVCVFWIWNYWAWERLSFFFWKTQNLVSIILRYGHEKYGMSYHSLLCFKHETLQKKTWKSPSLLSHDRCVDSAGSCR